MGKQSHRSSAVFLNGYTEQKKTIFHGNYISEILFEQVTFMQFVDTLLLKNVLQVYMRFFFPSPSSNIIAGRLRSVTLKS